MKKEYHHVHISKQAHTLLKKASTKQGISIKAVVDEVLEDSATFRRMLGPKRIVTSDTSG